MSMLMYSVIAVERERELARLGVAQPDGQSTESILPVIRIRDVWVDGEDGYTMESNTIGLSNTMIFEEQNKPTAHVRTACCAPVRNVAREVT